MAQLSSCLAAVPGGQPTENLPRIRRLSADERGAVFSVIVITVIPLIIALGIVIDISRAYLVRSQLSEMARSAALVSGRAFDADLYIADVKKLFAVNVDMRSLGAELADTSFRKTFDKVANTLTVKAEVTVPTYFLHLAGIDLMTVDAHAIHRAEAARDVAESDNEQVLPDVPARHQDAGQIETDGDPSPFGS